MKCKSRFIAFLCVVSSFLGSTAMASDQAKQPLVAKGVFCSQSGGHAYTIALSENVSGHGTIEVTEKHYAVGTPPCGIDRSYPGYAQGTYEVDLAKSTISIRYPNFTSRPGKYFVDGNNQIQNFVLLEKGYYTRTE